ncbi:hypothetical protein CDAR_572261 [Caerostris darwini]|uniref:Transposase n=1 Tax=Caerostris darwini TaxID=1538125 RepID=A0AAV4PI79_9ARAC|nr:hypothetical protein CDAR_572261 [Caerostris darwini]
MHIGVECALEKGLIDTGIRICRYPEERPLAVLLQGLILSGSPAHTADDCPHRWLVDSSTLSEFAKNNSFEFGRAAKLRRKLNETGVCQTGAV